MRRPISRALCALAFATLTWGFALAAGAAGEGAAPLIARQAAEAYDQGRYAEAAQLYGRLAASGGEGAEVRYDLGNCYLKAGDLGRAILEYRRALAFSPRLVPAQRNLALAHSLLPARVAPWQPSPWETALSKIPVAALQWLVLGFALLGNLGLAVVLLASSEAARRVAAWALVGGFLVAGVAGFALISANTVLPSHRPAVVLKPAAVYAAPEASGAHLSTLPVGSEVILTARAGDRALVMWGEGRGWTSADAVEVP